MEDKPVSEKEVGEIEGKEVTALPDPKSQKLGSRSRRRRSYGLYDLKPLRTLLKAKSTFETPQKNKSKTTTVPRSEDFDRQKYLGPTFSSAYRARLKELDRKRRFLGIETDTAPEETEYAADQKGRKIEQAYGRTISSVTAGDSFSFTSSSFRSNDENKNTANLVSPSSATVTVKKNSRFVLRQAELEALQGRDDVVAEQVLSPPPKSFSKWKDVVKMTAKSPTSTDTSPSSALGKLTEISDPLETGLNEHDSEEEKESELLFTSLSDTSNEEAWFAPEPLVVEKAHDLGQESRTKSAEVHSKIEVSEKVEMGTKAQTVSEPHWLERKVRFMPFMLLTILCVQILSRLYQPVAERPMTFLPECIIELEKVQDTFVLENDIALNAAEVYLSDADVALPTVVIPVEKSTPAENEPAQLGESSSSADLATGSVEPIQEEDNRMAPDFISAEKGVEVTCEPATASSISESLPVSQAHISDLSFLAVEQEETKHEDLIASDQSGQQQPPSDKVEQTNDSSYISRFWSQVVVAVAAITGLGYTQSILTTRQDEPQSHQSPEEVHLVEGPSPKGRFDAVEVVKETLTPVRRSHRIKQRQASKLGLKESVSIPFDLLQETL